MGDQDPKQADLEVDQQTCAIRFPQTNGSKYKVWAYTCWQRTGGGPIPSKRVEDYIVHARLEFNDAGNDPNVETAECPITAKVNAEPAGRTRARPRCPTLSTTTGRRRTRATAP